MLRRIPHLRKRILCLFFLAGCTQDHLYVQQEWIDQDFLASTHVHTPDPRQDNPPVGQRLLIRWWFPQSSEALNMHVQVRFWDNREKEIVYPLCRKKDSTAFFFPCASFQDRILTYRVQVINERGEIVGRWDHHFWTELIDVDRREKGHEDYENSEGEQE